MPDLNVKRDVTAQAIRDAWRDIVPNYDEALGHPLANAHLRQLSADDKASSNVRDAFAERRAEVPEFFEAHDYAWCNDHESFDFPIEAAYQVRLLDAAIGLWTMRPTGIPIGSTLGRLVARTTYLAKFNQVTPHTQQSAGFDFVVCPLGWVEFIHRYFAGLTSPSTADEASPSRRAHFLGIIVNLVASSVNQVDYTLPSLCDHIVETVPEFNTALPHFSAVHESAISRDLAYATHDFALCHELAHIIAADHQAPDEFRADEWGLNTYWWSWGRRIALHQQLASLDPIRATIAPRTFASALRALLGARHRVATLLAAPERSREATATALDLAVRRGTALHQHSETLLADFLQHPAAPPLMQQEYERLTWFTQALLAYEADFTEFLTKLDPAALIHGQQVAKAAEAALLSGSE